MDAANVAELTVAALAWFSVVLQPWVFLSSVGCWPRSSPDSQCLHVHTLHLKVRR